MTLHIKATKTEMLHLWSELKDNINKGRIKFLDVNKKKGGGGNTQILFVWNMLHLWSELKDKINKGRIKFLDVKKKGRGAIHKFCLSGICYIYGQS